MKRFILATVLFILTALPSSAQSQIYLPIIIKSNMSTNPILRIVDNSGNVLVDILEDFKLADPYWNPNISQYKGGGAFASSSLAEGRRLTHKEYDNVVETIPLAARGINQEIRTKQFKRLENYYR
jgi:hypothetical protein